MNDPLLGLDRWPGVAASYDVSAGAQGAATLRLQLAFDAAAYSPGPAASAADLPEATEAPAWQLAALQALPSYDLLAEQLPATDIAYASSLLPGGERALDAAPRASLLDWLFGEGGVQAFLRARSEGDAACAAPASWAVEAAFDRALGADPLFELLTSITLSRPETPADAEALDDTPPASSATSFLVPREEGDGLAGFARRIEACLAVPGVCIHKLATSMDGTHARLWLVRLGLAPDQPIRLRRAGAEGSPAGDPLFFAPRPLYAVPQSRANLPFYDYVPGRGIDFGNPGGTGTFAGIDAGTWLHSFLAAIDAADAIDAPPFAADLQAARQQLAQALSLLVVPVLADQAPAAAQYAAAREAFRQQALLGLSAAHASDAVVQFALQVDATGSAQQQLHGSLLSHAGSHANAVLTPASVPLRQAGPGVATPLSFLLTAASEQGARPKAVTLDLTFRGLRIQAGSSLLSFVLPPGDGGDGPLDVRLGRFDVPVALRGLPAPPPPLEQEALTYPVQAPGGWPQVVRALQWDFRFAWQDSGHPQDTLQSTVRFNGEEEEPRDAAQAAGAPAAAADPLPALFAFAHAYPQLRAGLEGVPDPLAQQAFVQLVQRVAQALSAFVSAAPGAPAATPADAATGVPAAQGAITLEALDPVAVQSARAWLSIERNPWLLPGRRTADAFVLRSAVAGFTSAVQPMVRIEEPVDLAAVGGAAPVVRPLGAQLDNALSVLFARAPAGPQMLQVAAAYAADAGGVGTVSLPVLLIPPLLFQPKRAQPAVAPAAGGEEARTQDELVAGLQDGVRRWFADQQPAPGGALVFTLTVFARAGGAGRPVPLLVLDALTLRAADWT